ncbi:ER membrane protein complex subunit 10 [Dermacentor albipictus]|uniref:ER membrane protein complex subunit 10 n=1 Tax=Dermacentor albipictus TaxID=60249 RepID=UPI0038FC85F4
MPKFLVAATIFAAVVECALANDIDDKLITLAVSQSFDSGSDITYVTRAILSVPLARPSESTLHQVPLSASDAAKLRNLAEENGLYRVRVAKEQSDPAFLVSTFVKACSLYESELKDHFMVTLDRSGALLGVSDFVGQQCTGMHVPDHKLVNFNTTLSVSIVNIAPGPDTQTYIRRLEQEKAERARGENADNRSFFAKYWMYIMPLLIFLLISGASNPEGQGGGSSGR